MQQQAVLSPLVHLTATDRETVKLCGTALLLHSSQALDLAETEAFIAEANPGTAVIRLFGARLNWLAVSAALQLIAPDQAVPCRIYRPHPQLDGAIELLLSQPLSLELQQKLATCMATDGVELVYLLQRPTLTQPGLLVMDMDSTAIQIECIDEIAKLAGVGEQVAAVTARAMNGELDFAQSLIARVAELQGASEAILRQVLEALPLMPGLTELVRHLKAQQWQVAIASGGFTYFTDALKLQLGLTATFANVLEIVDGKLTGKVSGDIVDANTKAEVINRLATEYSIAAQQTVAIGDGANDIPMLKAAALGVAFHAKPKVQAQAKAAIRRGSLLQLLYLLD
nr:phosphoserine phosphatase SerB [Rheinheimera maricola]